MVMTEDYVVIQCTFCSTKNRVPVYRLKERALCGKCRRPIMTDPFFSKSVKVTDASFADEVLNYNGPVLVDFWAPWCGPCKMVSPILDQLASEYSGTVKIAKLNVDENPVIASKYGIRSIPSLLFFKNGKIVNTLMGVQPKAELQRHIQSLL
jgi:thioredoxin 2